MSHISHNILFEIFYVFAKLSKMPIRIYISRRRFINLSRMLTRVERREALVTEEQEVIKDANGNVLADGDSVTVIKDLKIKGSSSVVKVGTKVKSIRLVPDASDGHNIDCKIDGIGQMKLKSEFVKKLNLLILITFW